MLVSVTEAEMLMAFASASLRRVRRTSDGDWLASVSVASSNLVPGDPTERFKGGLKVLSEPNKAEDSSGKTVG